MRYTDRRRKRPFPRVVLLLSLAVLVGAVGFAVGQVTAKPKAQALAATYSSGGPSASIANSKDLREPDAVARTLAEVQASNKDLPAKIEVTDASGNLVGYVDRDNYLAIPTDPPGEPLRSIFGDNPGYLVRNAEDQPIGFLVPGTGYMGFAEADARGLTGKTPSPR